MFLFWHLIKEIIQDPRVNRVYGDGQWCIQECWTIYILKQLSLLEKEENSYGRSEI